MSRLLLTSLSRGQISSSAHARYKLDTPANYRQNYILILMVLYRKCINE
jgi:hypothetical protein